jgi:archaellum component FlaF (FlaF/FlaG flagellin family)
MSTITVGNTPNKVVSADFNNDGKSDLAVMNDDQPDSTCYPFGGRGTISILLGNGDGTFSAGPSPVCFPAGLHDSGDSQLTIADLNGDGIPDLIARFFDDGAGYAIYYGNGDGTFTLHDYDVGWDGVGSFVAADFDADGLMDTAIPLDALGETSVAVFLGNGNTGGFSGWGNNDTRISAGDFNHDGLLDLIWNGGEIALGVGNGNFTTAAISGFPSTGDFQNMAVADFDGDGNLDFATPDLASNSLLAFRGHGDGTFTQVTGQPSLAQFSNDVAVADLNGDGKLDLVFSDDCLSPCVAKTIEIFLGNGDGTFQPGMSFTVGNAPQSVAVGDFNGDGRLDIAVANPGDNTVSILLQAPVAQANASGLTFAAQTVGTTSSPLQVLLSNAGSAALTVSNVQISGDYQIQDSQCAGLLAPGAQCAVDVVFTPTASGTRTGALSFIDNAPNSPQAVSLTGVGAAPTITLSPASLTFPLMVVGTTSKFQTVTLTNTGVGVLNVANIATTGQFRHQSYCGLTLNPGASCTVSVVFTPTNIGTLTGGLFIKDNAAGSPQRVTLSGTGTYLQITPTNGLNFGTLPVGTTSSPMIVALTNKGSVTVNISSIAITGMNAGDFLQTNTCGSSVASGASCAVRVRFAPTATGTRTASVSITDDGGGSPQQVSLAGTATAGKRRIPATASNRNK